MTPNGILQILLYLLVLLICVKPLGVHIARVYEGQKTVASFLLGWCERLIFRLAGVDPGREMGWKEYAFCMLGFNALGVAVLYLFQRLQHWLPLNPQAFPAVAPDSAFNTAVSFVTNTNWQAYGGETTMSYLVQMAGLGVQNFLSAATGLAVLAALIRGLRNRGTAAIGNFWVDLTRSTLYILLPLAVVWTLLLVPQGVVQTFSPYRTAPLLQPIIAADGRSLKDQTLPLGPAASQIAIKQLGTNGGGFFNANSAHPFENPTPLSNFWESIAILLIPAALCYTFGRMLGDVRQGWALLLTMGSIFVAMLFFCVYVEQQGNPAFAGLGINQSATPLQAGGNMEGKEVRFGIVNSALWATATTAASNGSVNSMHDSFLPLGGFVPLFMIELGEVVFGGVGSGLYGLLMYVIVAVFVAGLMVGRTPEYLGKKIEPFEMKMAALVILIPPALVLLGTALGVLLPAGTAALGNSGSHGFSEILYAFSSAVNNNGSAFAGLNANSLFYNTVLGLCMLFGRFWLAIPVLAIAGSMARKGRIPVSSGTLPTHTPLFVVLIIGTVIIVGVLTYVPALALGPIIEHVSMIAMSR